MPSRSATRRVGCSNGERCGAGEWPRRIVARHAARRSRSPAAGSMRLRGLCVAVRASSGSRIQRLTSIPAIIATTNSAASATGRPSEANAGPGQYPAMPQPIPNSAEPATSGTSMSRRVGRSSRVSNSGLPRLMMSGNRLAVTANAPPMTSARLGSHTPKTSRKPTIFCGLVIPASTSPNPNRAPLNRAPKSRFTLVLRRAEGAGSRRPSRRRRP